MAKHMYNKHLLCDVLNDLLSVNVHLSQSHIPGSHNDFSGKRGMWMKKLKKPIKIQETDQRKASGPKRMDPNFISDFKDFC